MIIKLYIILLFLVNSIFPILSTRLSSSTWSDSELNKVVDQKLSNYQSSSPHLQNDSQTSSIPPGFEGHPKRNSNSPPRVSPKSDHYFPTFDTSLKSVKVEEVQTDNPTGRKRKQTKKSSEQNQVRKSRLTKYDYLPIEQQRSNFSKEQREQISIQIKNLWKDPKYREEQTRKRKELWKPGGATRIKSDERKSKGLKRSPYKTPRIHSFETKLKISKGLKERHAKWKKMKSELESKEIQKSSE